jgi:hypothetical protein
VYSLITVNPDTGVVVSSTAYGSAMGDNPLQMVSMISPSGVLYQGTKGGLLRVQAIVPEPSALSVAIGGIAWATWRGRKRWRQSQR